MQQPSSTLCAAGCIVVVLGLAALGHVGARDRERAAVEEPERSGSREKRAAPSGPSAAALRDGRPLDLNTATPTDLEMLPGIGPALAKRIVQRRSEMGPYDRVDALTQVSGIGPKVLARIRGSLSVGPMSPGDAEAKTEQVRPVTNRK